MFCLTPRLSKLGRIGIVLVSNAGGPELILRAYKDVGSASATDNEGLADLSTSGLFDLVELAAEEEEAEKVEENGEKTAPNTRFAFSREASFPSSTRMREGFFGLGAGG